jgi:C4-dicarboxylate-specific signal transduction histidine kinase
VEGRLIIVDDEPVILKLLGSVFAGEAGLEVAACPDGTSALAAMAEGVDVLLTDKNLPDVGGLELAARARADHDCEVIVITGYASLDTALEAMQLDVFDYIVKPPKDIFDVKRKVKQALDKLHMARENRQLMADLQERNDELAHALEELREMQAELIQSEKLAGIGTLAAGIAHEVSSPLFGVMGLAEAILEEDDRELVEGYAKEIVDYSRTITELVVQLSGYSRSASQEYRTTVELATVVEDAVRLVARSSAVDAGAVELDLQPGVFVLARTSEVQQVFVNLVKNALEALDDFYTATDGGFPGRVRVRVYQDERFVHAEVRDNGPGIDPANQQAIFDPFYTTKPPGRGTGLGLNIVYRIVTKYQGQISVQSAPGEGTAFLLRFPREE